MEKTPFFPNWEDFEFNPFIFPLIFKTYSEIETNVFGLRRWENPLLHWEPSDPDQGN